MQRSKLSIIHRRLLSLYNLALRKPRLVLCLTGIALMICLYGLSQTRIILTVDDMQDPDFPSLGQLESIKNRFHPGHAVVLTFYTRDQSPITAHQLCAIQEWLRLEQQKNGEIQMVMSGFDAVRSKMIANRLVYDRIIKPHCTADQSGSAHLLSQFAGTPWENIATGRQFSTFNVSLQFRNTPYPTPFGVFDPRPIREMADRAEIYFADTSLDFHLVGTGAFRLFLAEALLGDQWLNVLFAIILALMFRLFLGSWKGGILIFINIGIVATLLFGLMGLAGVSLDMISNSLVIIVMIAAIQDFLFVSFHQRTKGSSYRKAFRTFLLPGFFTSLTTIMGFGSLLVSEFTPIQTFGLWAGIGAILEWLVTFVVMPALISQLPGLQVWTRTIPGRWSQWTQALSRGRLPQPLVTLSVVVFFISLPAIFMIEPADEPNDYLAPSHPFNAGIHLLKQRHGWDTRIYLAFRQQLTEEKNRAVLAAVSQWPNVDTIEDPYAVSDYVLAGHTESIKDIIRAEFKGAPVYYHYFSEDDWTLARLYLKQTSTQIIDGMLTQIATICPQNECFLADTLVSFTEISHQLIFTMLSSFAVSLILVSCVIFGLTRAVGIQPFHALAILFSSFWGLGIIFLILIGFSIQINYVTVIFAAVLVGVAGDNAIHYILAGRSGGLATGVANRGEGSVQIYVTCAVTCMVFLFATLSSPRILGLLFFSGFMASLYGDLWLLKGLMRHSNRSS